MYWTALISGSLVSGLANGGALYFDFNDQTLLDRIGDKTFIPNALGVLVMLGLLFYASMEGWDIARKILEKKAAQTAKLADQQDAERRWASTPNRYKQQMIREGRAPKFRSLLPDDAASLDGIPRVPQNHTRSRIKAAAR